MGVTIVSTLKEYLTERYRQHKCLRSTEPAKIIRESFRSNNHCLINNEQFYHPFLHVIIEYVLGTACLCPPLKFIVEVLTPSVMIFGDGNFRR